MEPTLQEVGLAVKRLQWRHHREANRQLADLGLSLPQWDVLRHLSAQPDASLHDLAVLTFQTDQSMGTLAARMVDRGMLVRRDTRGRAVRHELTADGDRVRRAGADIIDGVFGESVGRLSPREQSTLHRLLLAAGADEEAAEAECPGGSRSP